MSASPDRGCPGIGMHSCIPSLRTEGKICRSLAAAAAALGAPPPVQSWNSYRDWRTGLEKATRELSTNVTVRTPQPSSVRATAQPKVPAGWEPQSGCGRPQQQAAGVAEGSTQPKGQSWRHATQVMGVQAVSKKPHRTPAKAACLPQSVLSQLWGSLLRRNVFHTCPATSHGQLLLHCQASTICAKRAQLPAPIPSRRQAALRATHSQLWVSCRKLESPRMRSKEPWLLLDSHAGTYR